MLKVQENPKTRRNKEEIKNKILDTLEMQGDLATKELAFEMGYAKVTSALSKAIKELMAEGKIVYSEPEKIHSRNQKVCLVRDMDCR